MSNTCPVCNGALIKLSDEDYPLCPGHDRNKLIAVIANLKTDLSIKQSKLNQQTIEYYKALDERDKLRKQLNFAIGVFRYKGDNGDGEALSTIMKIEEMGKE